MLSITLVCVGKMRETYYISAFAEYAKRLGAYCRFDLVELPEQRLPERPSQKEIHAALEKEAQAIRARIPKGAAVIAMCVEGKLLSSEALARQLAGYAAGGTSKVCFLVGGSFGLDEGLKREASLRLSMSPMTFPHHLARVMLAEHDGVLPLPVIINNKTVDPTDPQSPAVVQLETAMGAAIGLFEGAICVQVDRMRFLPVKTTNDLFIMRSDRFHLTDSYEMEDGNYIFPNVDLDPRYYKNIEDFNERFPYNVPSLAAANSVSIKGDWTFGRDVIMFADARLEDRNEPSYVPNGEYVGPMGIEPGDWV